MIETFEFCFTIGDLQGKSIIKIFPERDKRNLFSSGRYVCQEENQSYLDFGKWEADLCDTTHFSDKIMALRYALDTLLFKFKDLEGLKGLENFRNKLNRQISLLKKETLEKPNQN